MRHVHRLVYHVPPKAHETEAERLKQNRQWVGATPRPLPLFVKGVLAAIFTVFSLYVASDAWATMDFEMGIFKLLTFSLSFALTLPQLYQTTLMTLTFFALGRNRVFQELQQRRHPRHVFLIATALTLALPIVLPGLIVSAIFLGPHLRSHGMRDPWLVVVGLLDFIQTLVLFPLALVIIFSADAPSDVLVNIVAVQVFAGLDDEFVRALQNPRETKLEALETYCRMNADKGNDSAREALAEAEKKEKEETEEWVGALSKNEALTVKGTLACLFSLLSVYVTYDSWATMDFTVMLTFKTLTYLLAVALIIPQMYQTTLITLTFVAVSQHDEGKMKIELDQRRHPSHVLLIAFALFFTLPITLPLLVLSSLVGFTPPLGEYKITDFTIILVGLIDCLQTIVIFPLALVLIFNADGPTDVFIYLTVALVYASLDDEFVEAFSDPQAFKRDALETYCCKREREGNVPHTL
jgi:hypothetical protein